MLFSVDMTSSTPIYAQIVGQVKHAIASGLLQAGDALPSLREVAAQLRVNPLTVAKAYRELEANGIVVFERGRGTFVSAQATMQSAPYRREELLQIVERMLVESYYLGASGDEVREAVEDRLRALQSGALSLPTGTKEKEVSTHE